MATLTDYVVDERTKIQYPKKYKVFLLNDDYTTMEFVVDILMNVFHKNSQEADKVMLEIHKKDRGLCGIYTHEIAETKIMQVLRLADDAGHPLKAIMEEE